MKNTVKITFWIMLTAAVVLGINAGWDKYQEFRQAELARVMTVKDKKFDPGQLTEMAAALAAKPYVPPADNLPDELKKLNYDQYRDIRFSRENGPWYGKKLPFEIQFFHLGSLFLTSVPINEIVNGRIHPLKYSPAYFDYGKNRLNTDELSELGYAGFRLHNPLNTRTNWFPSSAPATSAHSANIRNTAFPPAGWRSTPPSRPGKNFRSSANSGWSGRKETTSRLPSTPCWTARARPASIPLSSLRAKTR